MNLPSVGDIAIGTVVEVYPSYAILLYEDGWTGLLHVSELSNDYIHSFSHFVKVGSLYPTEVLSVDSERGNAKVSIKRLSASKRRLAFTEGGNNAGRVDPSALLNALPKWIEETKGVSK
ncbi:MAG: S1 RNA-binding domain-containing protein [Candidatus Enteromonas sp.]|nr:S1 RNA-binding domain-containing protein [Candidatus Enteromonas sp.]